MLNVSARSDAPAAATAAHALRRECRRGAMTEQTSGRASGFVQANLVVLPAAYAYDFLGFSHRNPRPCPLIGFTDVGEPSLPSLGTDVDLRTDLPRYRVWESGELVDEPTDIRHLWRDDLVAFAIGCSFTFEAALIADGIPLRHIEQGRNVAMYRTSIDTLRCGRFHGPMVVSMRPMTPPDAIRAIQVTSRYPGAHGAPVHIGYPAGIGIADLHRPDYGDAVEVCEGELPVFWACGVTPQAVIAAAAPAFAITHAPGCMLVTDIPNADLALS